jgi:hypothetical protein
MAKHVEMMNYAESVDRDLEIGSGAVEGAIRPTGLRADGFLTGRITWAKQDEPGLYAPPGTMRTASTGANVRTVVVQRDAET